MLNAVGNRPAETEAAAAAAGPAWQAQMTQQMTQNASLAPDGMSIMPAPAPPPAEGQVEKSGQQSGGNVAGIKFLDLLQGSMPPQ